MSSKKKILPNLLVVSSTLILAIFLVVWNIHQYEQAKKTLSNELALHLESAINEISTKRFSSFIENISIKGLLQKDSIDNDDLTANVVILIDSVDTEIERNSIQFKSVVEKNDSSNVSRFLIKKNSTHGFLNMDSNTLTNANFIQELDLFKIQDNILGLGDTAQVFSLLREKLYLRSLPSEFFYSEEFMIDQESVLPIAFKSSNILHQSNYLNFKGLGNYLFSKVAFSILFSIFLLTLVITAFVVLMRSRKQQQRLVEIKNDFISNMTHELKTPISTVSVAIEAIRNFDVIEDKIKTNEYLDISSSELNRLSLLVDKVLKTTLLENGESMNKLQPVNMVAIVKDTLNNMQMHFDDKHIELTTEIEHKELMVLGDKLHLTNVVYNLIENAIKYSPEIKKIKVSVDQVGEMVRLLVDDNGIGIAQENQKQVFEKFYRVPNHNRHNVKGHGLGLSYVKQVITELKGTIELKSKVGKGSSFKILLKAH